MRYLAIDYGLKRVGLAVCDADEIVVSPLCQIETNSQKPEILLERLRRIINEYQIEAVVVGLPLNMDDSEGGQAKLTRQYTEQLAASIELPVHLQDERLSSMSADEILAETNLSTAKRKKRRDMLAACAILQDFLDNH